MSESPSAPKRTIFSALSLVQTDLAAVGISKDQTNQQQKYKFRGIDDVLNTLSGILSKHGVLIMPNVRSSEHSVVTTSNGKLTNHWKVVVDYHFYDDHGDSIVHTAQGECMDSSDKGLNKAMSAAFKYMIFQAFCVPLQGQDADSHSPELGNEQPLLTDRQHENIINLLRETNTEAVDFVKWLTDGNESALIRLTQDYYERAVASLEKKLKKMAEEYAQEQADGAASDQAGQEAK